MLGMCNMQCRWSALLYVITPHRNCLVHNSHHKWKEGTKEGWKNEEKGRRKEKREGGRKEGRVNVGLDRLRRLIKILVKIGSLSRF